MSYNNRVIEFGVNDGGVNGTGCFEIQEWADTTGFMNVRVAADLESADIWSDTKLCSLKMKLRLRT